MVFVRATWAHHRRFLYQIQKLSIGSLRPVSAISSSRRATGRAERFPPQEYLSCWALPKLFQTSRLLASSQALITTKKAASAPLRPWPRPPSPANGRSSSSIPRILPLSVRPKSPNLLRQKLKEKHREPNRDTRDTTSSLHFLA